MDWRFEAEMISAVFLCIIWIYSCGSNAVDSLKNRIFRLVFYATAFSILTSVLSLPLELKNSYALPGLITAGYYLHIVASPLVTVFWQLYTLAWIYELRGKSVRKSFILSLLPFAAYLLLASFNPATGLIVTINVQGTPVQGPFYWVLYAIHYVYCFIMFLTIEKNRRLIQREVRNVIVFFPVLIAAFASMQLMMRQVLLEGSAEVCVLLTAYLYLQNRRIYEDQLTGLPNRAAYINTLKVLTEQKLPIIALSISLNDFKLINDKFGQENGDLLLQRVAGFLLRSAPGSKVYRCGGDKFAVVFEDRRIPNANAEISRISDRFLRPWDIPGNICYLGAAMGVAYFPTTADNLQELVSTLESAVDRAKSSGSTKPIYCDRAIIDSIRRKYYVKSRLASALESDSFEVYFQPIYSIKDNCFFEAEALLRLRDENGKFIPPDEFIPIAEEIGLIVDIGYMVLDKVCKYIRNLLRSGVKVRTVSVNLSVAQLMKPDIVPRLLQIIHGNGISPDRIIFEITESILVSNYDIITEKVKKLHEAGISFALDDFGTGYSNLTYVIDLPFQMVKIDKSLIVDSMINKKCNILTRDLTQSFRSMELTMIAEGVETSEHDDFVRLCGFDRIQGYRYARPMEVSRAAGYLGRSLEEIAEPALVNSL